MKLKLIRRSGNRFFALIVTGAAWLATMYFRGWLTNFAPWQPDWWIWLATHDLMGACFGYQVGQIICQLPVKRRRREDCEHDETE